jgi:hypothetical protein
MKDRVLHLCSARPRFSFPTCSLRSTPHFAAQEVNFSFVLVDVAGALFFWLSPRCFRSPALVSATQVLDSLTAVFCSFLVKPHGQGSHPVLGSHSLRQGLHFVSAPAFVLKLFSRSASRFCGSFSVFFLARVRFVSTSAWEYCTHGRIHAPPNQSAA